MSTKDKARNSHKQPRTRPIRQRIALLLVIPLLSLVGLWGFAASTTADEALEKYDFTTVYEKIAYPTSVTFFMIQLERSAASVVLSTKGRSGRPQLAAIQAKTDQAVAVYRKNAASDEARDAVDPAIWQRVRALGVSQFDQLSSLRAQIDANSITTLDAIQAYSKIFDGVNRLLTNLENANDTAVYRESLAILNVNWARDFVLREDALMTGVAAAGGRIGSEQRTAFAGWAANRRHSLDLGLANLDGPVRASVAGVVSTPAFASFERLEASILDQRGNSVPKATLDAWRATAPGLAQTWKDQNSRVGALINAKAGPIGDRIMIRLGVAGGLGLLAVAASIVLSVFFVRDVSRELDRLQQAAQRLAHERLPHIVARLRRGEAVDVTADTPRFAVGRTREIAAVADAFTTVQNTAMETAVGEAELRKGISRVFMNLAWRSQSLLHRQLKMLDAMERRATSPDELEDLFRLDHLTTRMRRHAEGLVILSGSPTARGWNQPVPVEDLLRAALSEVEDYTRVDVMTSSRAALTGTVVADVIHLLAELIENATVFSPPTTEVLVRAEIVGNGLAIEVVDRGIGMAHEELVAINHRLAEPPEFDLADSDRLGLFVVARLAVRHGIKVVLQPSAYGGTTAVVLIPTELVILDGQPAVANGRGDQGRAGHGRAGHGPADHGMPQLTASGSPSMSPPSGPAPAGPAMATAEHRFPGSARAMREPFEPFEPVRQADTGRFSGFSVPPGRSQQGVGGGEDAFERVDHTAVGNTAAGAADGTVDGADGADSEQTGRLPRRVRQQNMAPQLRDRKLTRPAPPADDHFDEEDDSDRPEFSRDLMSSLQTGWTRGRDADEDAEDHGMTLFDEHHDDRWKNRGES